MEKKRSYLIGGIHLGKSPINWFGGKYYMAKKIIDLFPEHKVYVEVFGGAGHVLFQKEPSAIEVFNDINSNLVNFFRILRDDYKVQELHKRLQLTPHSREEFLDCYGSWEHEKDEIERVRKWYVTLMQCFSKSFGNKGWSYSKSISNRGMSQSTSQFLGKIDKDIPFAVQRLRGVQIDNLDFRNILEKYDSKDTLFYLDPPYVHDTRTMTYTYANEMTEDDHKDLVNLLLSTKGKVVLSGYDHEIYNPLIDAGWKRIVIGEYDKKSMRHNSETKKGTEIVWVNYC